MQALADLFGSVGTTIEGKYRVDDVVGKGGFGVVYRGYHLGFDMTERSGSGTRRVGS
ncbi:hypothetical protein [Sorangium sp. So ce693]|uniref:hypothetical protein n=1 Tax=Sorangium sp. So ce693 TaxID=3133318 RepID=UPI003F5E9BC5